MALERFDGLGSGVPDVRVDGIHDPLRIRDVATAICFFKTCRRVVVASLPVLEEAGQDGCELARERARVDEVLVEGTEYLRVAAIGLPTGQKHCRDGVECRVVRTGCRVAERIRVQKDARCIELGSRMSQQCRDVWRQRGTPSRATFSPMGCF